MAMTIGNKKIIVRYQTIIMYNNHTIHKLFGMVGFKKGE